MPAIPLSKIVVGHEEKTAVMDVLESGMLAQGKYVSLLEEAFTKVTGAKFAIAVSSGTAALHTALLAHQIGPGDEVITTSFTFIATINSILMTGAKPVFIDIEDDTFNLDPALIENAVTPRTKAILPVHLYGHPANMELIMPIAHKHDLIVIEDAAQAIGARLGSKPAGSENTSCFSLYATKNVMAGEGGMITTNDDGIADRCRLLRSHGMRKRYYHGMLGYNYRMNDISAAIGFMQMKRLDEFQAKRSANAAYYHHHLTQGIKPGTRAGCTHAWHQYTLRFPRNGKISRDAAAERLKGMGIDVGIFYPVPAHKQEYLQMGYEGVSLPVTEQMSEEVLSIPAHPHLTPGDLQAVASAINQL